MAACTSAHHSKQAFPQLLQRLCTLMWRCRCLTTPGSCPSSPFYTVLPSCPSAHSSTRLPCRSCGYGESWWLRWAMCFPPESPVPRGATLPSHFLTVTSSPVNLGMCWQPSNHRDQENFSRVIDITTRGNHYCSCLSYICHYLAQRTALQMMHKKTNQSFFCWSWFIARTLLHIEQDELRRDAPDYEMLKRLSIFSRAFIWDVQALKNPRLTVCGKWSRIHGALSQPKCGKKCYCSGTFNLPQPSVHFRAVPTWFPWHLSNSQQERKQISAVLSSPSSGRKWGLQ